MNPSQARRSPARQKFVSTGHLSTDAPCSLLWPSSLTIALRTARSQSHLLHLLPLGEGKTQLALAPVCPCESPMAYERRPGTARPSCTLCLWERAGVRASALMTRRPQGRAAMRRFSASPKQLLDQALHRLEGGVGSGAQPLEGHHLGADQFGPRTRQAVKCGVAVAFAA